MNVVWTKIKFLQKENFNLPMFKKKNGFLLAVKQKIWFLKKKGVGNEK